MRFRLLLPPNKITNRILSLVTDAVWQTNPTTGPESYSWDAYTTPISYVVECENCPKDFPKEGIHWQPCQN